VENVKMLDGGSVWSGQGGLSANLKDNEVLGVPYDYVYCNFINTAQKVVIDNSGTSVPVQERGKEAAIRIMNVNDLTLKGHTTKPRSSILLRSATLGQHPLEQFVFVIRLVPAVVIGGGIHRDFRMAAGGLELGDHVANLVRGDEAIGVVVENPDRIFRQTWDFLFRLVRRHRYEAGEDLRMPSAQNPDALSAGAHAGEGHAIFVD